MDARLLVKRFSDVAEFGQRAEAWLLKAEAEHNLLLGLVASLSTSPVGDEPPLYFCTIERDEEIHGCAFRTPPHKLGITRMPDEAMPLLVEDVAEVYDTLPAVLGPEPEASKFASLWAEKKGVPARAGVRQRIYQAEKVTMPERPAPGGPRLAVADDLELLVEWTAFFVADTGMRAPRDARGELERRVSEGQVWLWEDGSPRSMVGVTGYTARGARVGYVYTPLAWRGRG